MTRRLFAALALLPIALAAQDSTAAKSALLAADRAAFANADALGTALDARAAVLLPGHDILVGRRAWTSQLDDIVKAAGTLPGASPTHAVVSRDARFGCTTGVLHRVAADTTQPRTGRYAACWRRERDGTWRLLALSRAYAPHQVAALPDSLPGAPGSAAETAPRGAQPSLEMANADRAFAQFSADSGGPSGAFARWIAADGMMLGSRAVPVRGSDQARAAFANFPNDGRFEWGPVDSLTVAARDGSLGFTVGQARIAATPKDVSYSKYLTIWRREGDGRYRFVFDIGSDRPAPRTP